MDGIFKPGEQRSMGSGRYRRHNRRCYDNDVCRIIVNHSQKKSLVHSSHVMLVRSMFSGYYAILRL